jgi:uncharacterized membrane protein
MNQHFASLVMGIAAQAQAALEGHLPAESPIQDARLIAQTLIDTLGMLQDKTTGRLDDDERRLLEQVLAELRIRYVSGGGATGTAQH